MARFQSAGQLCEASIFAGRSCYESLILKLGDFSAGLQSFGKQFGSDYFHKEILFEVLHFEIWQLYGQILNLWPAAWKWLFSPGNPFTNPSVWNLEASTKRPEFEVLASCVEVVIFIRTSFFKCHVEAWQLQGQISKFWPPGWEWFFSQGNPFTIPSIWSLATSKLDWKALACRQLWI